MTRDDFLRLERWFQRAVEAEDRDAVVAACRAEDPALVEQLQAMLSADDAQARGDDRWKQVVADEAGTTPDETPPERIGPFDVVRRLGAGGMGVVYLCRRSGPDFEQQVAVKRLPAAGDSDFARERLKMERRVLASLRHPHIAQLVDGGEEADGTPWVAMEYVDGQPIDRWAAEQGLDRRDRVERFLALCDAVQFAHRNLVVHRDIKASNVLIDRHGQLKLLDFGIAKLVDDADSGDAPLTVASTMTPHYASPEQVRGETVTPASDVYSLGVLLFELLAGRRPYEFPTRRPSDIERIVCETEPPPLGGRNARDLDCIIARTMHKDPTRRYASARELADDLQRWLDGRPVEARPDSALYRAGRFLGRHPFGAGAAALIAVLVIGFGATMARQAHLLELERDAAAREARVAQETSAFLIDLFAVSDPREANPADVRARDMLDAAAERLPEELESDPLGRAQLMHVIGLAYSNLGLGERGLGLLREAMALRIEHAGEDSALVADSRNRLGNVLRRFGHLTEAEPLLVQALEWREENGPIDQDLADSYNNVGLLQNELGFYETAERSLRHAIELHRQVDGRDTDAAAAPLHNLALALRRQQRFDDAAEAAAESIAIKRAAGDWSLSSLAVTLAVLANIERQRGDLDAALAHSTESLALREQVFGRDNVLIASGLVTHANIIEALGDLDRAERLKHESVALFEADGSADSLRAADSQLGLGELLLDRGRFDEARPLLERAAASARRELPAGSPELERFEVALARLNGAD
ncbi:serine/threonine protein kinase [Wenzhouxiangella sp. XN79A]|uniref:serine/threonine-protein kinase n=1 Tax=Wenzhouxiangella sp. XN79A TaxID=2724193 RepID=UPI00144ADD23|nr:serine/threonine-protein kinase [Wenzhouxiangella sp. XN79A]NKI36339.1 serine/threonine protein kinase [Wenzhouxiangella sp. XN79A]